MSLFLRIIQHLLPSGEAFRTVVDKLLRRFFAACATIFEDAELYAANSYLDLFPETTRLLEQWEEHFGLLPSPNATENDRRLALAAEWRATGGQSPAYIQGVIQATGFDLYLHEWWQSFADWDPILWFRTDDPEAVVSEIHQGASLALLYATMNDAGAVTTSGTIASVPNLGTLGGALTSTFGTGPAVETVGGRRYGVTTTTGGLSFGTASSLALLHDPTGNATIVFRVRTDTISPLVPGWVFTTRTGTASLGRGVSLVQETNGRFYVNVSNGLAEQITLSCPTAPTVGEHVIAVRKTGNVYELLLDGAVVGSATASSLAAGSSYIPPKIGARDNDANPFVGALIHFGVWNSALLDQQIASFGLVGEFFGSVPNRGTLGGVVTPATGSGPGPEAGRYNSKRVARTTTTGGLKFGNTGSLTILHEPGTIATVGFLELFEASTSQTRVIATKGAAATARGVILYLSSGGVLSLTVCDGTTNTSISGTGVMPVGVPTSVIITKNDTLFAIYVNGVLYASGTAPLSAGASDGQPSFGSTTSNTTIVPGSIGELFVVPRALSAVEIDRAHRGLSRFATDLVGYVARDPFEWTEDPLAGTVQCGEDLAECADLDPPECDDFLANEPRYFENLVLTDRAPPGIPEDTDAHAYFLYFGGPKFGEFVLVPATRRAQLERLVQKLKPSQQWVVMLVYYYDDNIVVDESGFFVVEDDGSVVVAA